MYCRNHTKTVSRVFCREVYYTESLLGRVHLSLVSLYLYACVCTWVLTFEHTPGSGTTLEGHSVQTVQLPQHMSTYLSHQVMVGGL
jgi:hypothetical protein